MRRAIVIVAVGLIAGCHRAATGPTVMRHFPAATMPAGWAERILTPAPAAEPRITGARVYGERPERPFLFTITATGQRPMRFGARGLPGGLVLDSDTGRITGRVDRPGDFHVVVSARNSLGSASRDLHVIVGEKIALTPPMGWNSWNCWAGAVDEGKVIKSAHAMVSSGLSEHGWTYVNIDDTWQGGRSGALNALQSNEKFPDMKSLCEQIHGMGLKAGIYSTPWMTSYASFPGGSADTVDGKWAQPTTKRAFGQYGWQLGKFPFAPADARQFAQWGFDYLKYDWHVIDSQHVLEMHDALLASGRDIVYSLSNSAPFEGAGIWSEFSNCWRTTGDIRDTWNSLASIGFTQSKWAPFAGAGHFNDPDMLVVGYVGWGPNLHLTHLTPDEQYTHISLWSLLSAPLLIGCDLDRLDPFTFSLLTNDEVLAVDQDELSRGATMVSGEGGEVEVTPRGKNAKPIALARLQVWSKELADGSRAVGLFNLGESKAEVTVKFSDLKVSGPQHVRDLWRQQDVGVVGTEYKAMVPAHGVSLLKISGGK